ncbi:unnamed protein product, partial [Musa acuminata var. zebrina]
HEFGAASLRPTILLVLLAFSCRHWLQTFPYLQKGDHPCSSLSAASSHIQFHVPAHVVLLSPQVFLYTLT